MEDSLQKIRDVKKKYEQKWLSLPGVSGVGIGTTGQGEVGIILSVEGESDRIRKKIPSRVEGVSVEIRETGAFRAL